MKYIKIIAKAIGIKILFNLLQDFLLKLRGYDLLSKAETLEFMKPYQVLEIPENNVFLSKVINCGNPDKVVFADQEITTDKLYVWDYKDAKRKPKISKYGSVVIRGKVLCTDRTHGSFYRDIWLKDDRPAKQAAIVIAPFSHYQDPKGYGGYFDYVFFVIVKLCRMKDALPAEDFSKVIVSYVPFQSSYETEYLQLLGINQENLVDCSKTKIITPRVIAANGRTWNPNIADILSLKRHIGEKIKPIKTSAKRIYISRGIRRRVSNEDELITLLKKFDFTIIEDKPRSIAEQIDIYYNASFIIGPHGASFGNIIWCQPDTCLLELFSPNYMPNFFAYLSSVMQMKYAAYYHGSPDSTVDYMDGLLEDIYVSIPELEMALNSLL